MRDRAREFFETLTMTTAEASALSQQLGFMAGAAERAGHDQIAPFVRGSVDIPERWLWYAREKFGKPVAWIRVRPGSREFVFGHQPPDNGDGWVPVYGGPA